MISYKNLDTLKKNIFEYKHYFSIYLIFSVVSFSYFFFNGSQTHLKFELLIFSLALIIGILNIYSYMSCNKKEEFYKVVFVIILSFGLICSCITPIGDVSDETEHFARAEISSEGILFPHWTGEDLGYTQSFNKTTKKYNENVGFETIGSAYFARENNGNTILNASGFNEPINYTSTIIISAFEQNPFYGYLPQSIGILTAKLLDLNEMWMFLLGRIFNILTYALLISLAIKIAPDLKMPLALVSCIPISIYQSASFSIDALIFGLGILTVSYFIYLYNLNGKLDYKQLMAYMLLCLLLGLCKLPYLAFSFLMLFLPKDKLDKNKMLFLFLMLAFVSIAGLLWSQYAQPALLHSWRSSNIDVNSTSQLLLLMNSPIHVLEFLKQIFTQNLYDILLGFFKIYKGFDQYFVDKYFIISLLFSIFLSFTLISYPKKVKFENKTKIGAFLIMLLIYVATCFIQLLTWSAVGKMNLGIASRYFVPLCALIPIISGYSINIEERTLGNYTIVFMMIFLSITIFGLVTSDY